jgi:hypothetical protein
MNREIKFRGKRLDNGKWVFGDLLTKHPHHKGLTIVESGGLHHEVDPETVGQYTGITDKGKNKMFEGDLYRSDGGYIFEVVYLFEVVCLASEACFVGVLVKEPESWVFLEDALGMKRVGNKWDDSDLLSGGDTHDW